MFARRAEKHISSIASWEISKKAALEAELKKIEVMFTVYLIINTITVKLLMRSRVTHN